MKGLRLAIMLCWAGPFAILAWTFWHVRQNWTKMAARYPTHWGFNGPDEWASATPENVSGTLAFGAGLCVVIAAVSWFAYNRSSRKAGLKQMLPSLGAAYVCAVAVSMSPLSGLYEIHAGRVLLPMVVILLALSVGVAVTSARSDDATGWIGGVIYYNPNDPALWVQSFTGAGWTVNFARPAAWAIVGGAVALPFLIQLVRRFT